MAQTETAEPRVNFGMAGWRLFGLPVRTLAVALALIAVPLLLQLAGTIRLQALASWVEVPAAMAEHREPLAEARAALQKMPVDMPALAARATQEGHWHFVNRSGETLTAGTPDEMQRLATLLLPDAKPADRITIVVPLESLARYRPAFKDLPKGSTLRAVAAGESFPILGRADSAGEGLFVEVRPGILLDTADEARAREALWQLQRPIERARVRILALEPGGPSTLAPLPRKDPDTGRAMVDVIDPASLAQAMGSVRGQTLIVTGRVDNGVLYVQPSSGAERGVLVSDLLAAADASDANLVILKSASTPRQPGGRNWFWQRIEVKGLESGLARPRLVDLLDAIGGTHARFLASARVTGDRTSLDLQAGQGLPAGANVPSVREMLLDAFGDVTGRVVANSVEASLRSAARQREIDRRIVPALPSVAQAGYVLLFIVGLAGLPVARRWWARIWPPEDRAEYGNVAGYHAACAIRMAIFLGLFLPIAALLAAPKALGGVLLRPFRRSPVNGTSAA
ncbi:MAG: hypothetical protein EKK41_09410 [Hyphomicrobiales bacterium]|nr:MAG: hypothetical protein EKK41_09410 [Hyphomicrobiales bacterium]